MAEYLSENIITQIKIFYTEEFKMETKIKDLIAFLKDKYPNGAEMYNTRNLVGDILFTIYSKDGITVDECPKWEYIEIFGLTENEFDEVNKEINKNNPDNLLSLNQLFEKTLNNLRKLQQEEIKELKEKALKELLDLVNEMADDKDFFEKMKMVKMFFNLGLADMSTFKEFRKLVIEEINRVGEKIKRLEGTEE